MPQHAIKLTGFMSYSGDEHGMMVAVVDQSGMFSTASLTSKVLKLCPRNNCANALIAIEMP